MCNKAMLGFILIVFFHYNNIKIVASMLSCFQSNDFRVGYVMTTVPNVIHQLIQAFLVGKDGHT